MKRESLNTPIQSPHFQGRSGMLNHVGGSYSHGGMMDYPRILYTEGILENFLTLLNFKAGKSTTELRVCLRTADPQITMLCIKEVEMRKR